VLVLIRMIFSLVVLFTLLLSLVAITSPVTGSVEKAVLLAFVLFMVGSEAAVWRLTRPARAAS
jgi:Ni/Fe-hydrogenase subunit HybB-like protein